MEEQEDVITGQINDYTVTLTPPLGRGTFGTVHKAEHNTTNEITAAKQMILAEGKTKNEYMHSMAEKEIKIIRELKDHENIVQLRDSYFKGNICWIFLEYCDLGNLKVYLKENPSLDLEKRITIMNQSASAIAFMHRQKPPIIHRDIKLENIMMKKEGDEDVVKLTDFGLSKLCEERQALSKAFNQGQYMNTKCGSQYFMAPEFFEECDDGVKYDASVDVYALGLVFLILLQHGQSETNEDFLPLSVEATRSKKYVSIGEEMVGHTKCGRPFPTVVRLLDTDDMNIRRIKRIITHMTKYRAVQRKNIQEVDDEMLELIDTLKVPKIDERQIWPIRARLEAAVAEVQHYQVLLVLFAAYFVPLFLRSVLF